MKILCLFFSILLLAAPSFAEKAAPIPAPTAGQAYGTPITEEKPVDMVDVMKNFDKYKGKKIVTHGVVYEVCTMEGCWLKLQDREARVRVIMKEHGFKVPKEIKDKKILAEGVMEEKEMPAKVIQHYMKDEGKSQKEIDKVTGPQKMFQFVADGVKVASKE